MRLLPLIGTLALFAAACSSDASATPKEVSAKNEVSPKAASLGLTYFTMPN